MSLYSGLINQGSTCYLNSLLQTLFMTKEFRQRVFQYHHDPKRIREEDSIPFQLQKLFVMMQLRENLPSTRGLLKSFQWTEADAFQQHDVQEFFRVLFEALDKAQKNSNATEALFGGTLTSFIDCGKHRSIRQEAFMDISLPIRNAQNNLNYNSLEECLKEFVRPQSIQGVECSECGEKVSVMKGLEFSSLPQIFAIQLNRFELNYKTMQREKVNSFVYFPQILPMGQFSKKFQDILLDGIPKSLKQKTVIKEKKSERTMDWGAKDHPKPKRKNSDNIESNKEEVRFLDQEKINQKKCKPSLMSKETERQKDKAILNELKNERNILDHRMQAIKFKETQSIQNDMLFGSAFGAMSGLSWNSGVCEKPSFEKEINFQHEEQSYNKDKKYPVDTYILYAVLVHSGGAHGGHYYAYIFDGSQWFKFDDSSVVKVSKEQIRKYGNPQNSTSHGANAYLLFYRRAETMSTLEAIDISVELQEKVRKNCEKVEETSNWKTKRYQQMSNGVLLKIFKNDKEVHRHLVEDRNTETVGGMRQKIKQLLGIQEKDQNWRLRRYNKTDCMFYQIYGGQISEMTLESVGLRDQFDLGIETKGDKEVFEDYDSSKITIKANIWRPGIKSISEKYLNPLKILIKEQEQFSTLYQIIKMKSNLKQPLIMKRNYSLGNPITIIGLEQNKSKKLIELRFFNSLNIYVEEEFNQGNYRWMEQFEAEKYRCQIKFNNPLEGEERDKELFFDTRKTLGDLKDQISEIIGLPTEEFRLKKWKQSTVELTAFRKKLADLKFINQEYLYLEIGKSSKGFALLRNGQVCLLDDNIEFNLGAETLVALSANITNIDDLKQKLAQIVGFSSSLIRIRQYKACQFGQIFQGQESIDRIKEKSLVWQQLKEPDPKGIQVYVRVFDLMSMELGQLKEIFINQGSNYQEFAYVLEEQTGVPAGHLLCWKALSNYIEKSALFDCEWYEIRYIPKQLREEPLYLNRDGEIVIIKKSQEAYQKKINPISANKAPTDGKETQLKITVIEQQDPLPKDLAKMEKSVPYEQSNHPQNSISTKEEEAANSKTVNGETKKEK